MTSVSASHIILTPTQPVRSGRLERGSNQRPRHQESCALPTELPRPPQKKKKKKKKKKKIKKKKKKKKRTTTTTTTAAIKGL